MLTILVKMQYYVTVNVTYYTFVIDYIFVINYIVVLIV